MPYKHFTQNQIVNKYKSKKSWKFYANKCINDKKDLRKK